MHPPIQHQNHLADYDTSYKSMDPTNRREVEEVIGNGMALVMRYDGKHCPRCNAFTWGEHWCYSCGWVLAVLAPNSLPTVGRALKQREYGVVKCERCNKSFMRRVSNARRCPTCREWLRTHRHG